MKKRPTAVLLVLVALGVGLGTWALAWLNIETRVLPPNATLPSGARYYGDVADGKFHGDGKLIYPTGARYEGEFRDGLFHGSGRLVFADTGTYEGEFRDGMMSGYGRLTDAGGSVYVGEFQRDLPYGRGTWTYASGDVYEGRVEGSTLSGQGRYTLADGGGFYEGTFVDSDLTGPGTFFDGEGNKYEGNFVRWERSGRGTYTTADGDVYQGEFENDLLVGEGRFTGNDGRRYRGAFDYGVFDGKGVLTEANGDQYVGTFSYGTFHGDGTLTYAEPKDGMPAVTGTWKNGALLKPEEDPKRVAELVETALYNQNQLLAQTLEEVLPGDNMRIELYFVGVGGDGTQNVFRREISFIKQQFDEAFGAKGRSVVLINNPDTVTSIPMATVTSLEQTLRVVAERMNPEDILFLYLTSHGSKDHEFVLDQRGLNLPWLPAQTLAETLHALPVKWKVVVVSACYSGGYLAPLRDQYTLIMTAANHDKPSFGCSNEAEMTYFGRAFFKEALPASRSFSEAFETARSLVIEWEAGHDTFSDPQIWSPEPIREHLAKWWEQQAHPNVPRLVSIER